MDFSVLISCFFHDLPSLLCLVLLYLIQLPLPFIYYTSVYLFIFILFSFTILASPYHIISYHVGSNLTITYFLYFFSPYLSYFSFTSSPPYFYSFFPSKFCLFPFVLCLYFLKEGMKQFLSFFLRWSLRSCLSVVCA